MKRLYNYILALILMVGLSGCSLDINKDPYAVTTLDVEQLLTAAEFEVGVTFSEGSYLNANFSAYVHHTVSREVDNYGLSSTYPTLTNTWAQAYMYAIKNCDELIRIGDAEGYAVYAGIGRVLRAHVYMNMTDLWGNIPYTEANVVGIDNPKLDSSELVYNELLKSLNAAIANFKDENAANGMVPAANDLFFGGNVEKWLKVANTLKLKLLVQSRLAKSKVAGWDSELSALLAEGNFIGDGEDLQFPHTTTKAPMDERKFGFVDEYEGSQKSMWISPWLYEIMNGKSYNVKDNPFKNIQDPRTNYYYYNQLTAADAAENITDYRDGAFVSIMSCSNSGFTAGMQDQSMTVVGIYPVGGKFDDGKGGAITPKSGNGVAPDKMLQAYSVPFLKAELVLAGETAGDAKALLGEGIKASITHVNAVSKASDPNTPAISDEVAQQFIDYVYAKYDAADADRKMEIVMTQKWIANFFNPIEAYNDIRRTGYPVLFTGEEGTAVSPYKQSAEPVAEETIFNLASVLDYPRVMWYPNNETTVNPNITNDGRVVSEKLVFWDVK